MRPDVVSRPDRREPRRTDADQRVVLLGTAGGSNPKATRNGYSNAVVVGDTAYLVDCGEGVHRQLWRAGLTVNPNFGADRPIVRSIFVTHLHADHIMDLVNVFMGSWPAHAVDVYGPEPATLPIGPAVPDLVHPLAFPDSPTPGIRLTVEHLLRAFAYNINTRIVGEGRADVTRSVRVHELGDLGSGGHGHADDATAPMMEPVVVVPEDDRGVTVRAVLVRHAPVFPSFGYRFDGPHGAVVFSGDTGPCDNVVALAAGADVLVHEVIDVERLTWRLSKLPNYEAIRHHLATSHSTPEEVGEIATRAGVGTLVLSHLVPGDGEVTEDEWEARARTTFDGDVVCGVDLDEFPLG